MKIGIASLDDPDTRALLAEHQRRMLDASPPGTSFALDLSGLAARGVTVFEARGAAGLLGVAALKQLDRQCGEIKSMRVAEVALGSGVGLALLRHLMAVARGRGYETLLLETGTGAPFAAANALYLRNGFTRRGPFADYVASEFNIFYECRL